MVTLTPESRHDAEQKLVAAGALRYVDWPLYQWYSATGEALTQAQVDELCGALLAREASAVPAETSLSPEPAAEPMPTKRTRRGGRPRMREEDKPRCVSTWISQPRYAQLQAIAKELNLSLSKLIQPLVEPKHAKNQRREARRFGSGLSVEDRLRQRQLAGLAGSLDLLARRAQAEGLTALVDELRGYLQPIRDLLNA